MSPTRLTAVIDANVLIPELKGDFFLTAAFLRLFTPVLSERLFDESFRNLDPAHHGRLRAAREYFSENLDSGWEHLEHAMPLTRCPEDRHVLALALHAQAGAIVTEERALIEEINALDVNVVACSADDYASFLSRSWGPSAIGRVVSAMADKRINPPVTEDGIWDRLAAPAGGLPHLVSHQVAPTRQRSATVPTPPLAPPSSEPADGGLI